MSKEIYFLVGEFWRARYDQESQVVVIRIKTKLCKKFRALCLSTI